MATRLINSYDHCTLKNFRLLAAISSLTLTPRFLDRVVPPDQTFDLHYCGIFRYKLNGVFYYIPSPPSGMKFVIDYIFPRERRVCVLDRDTKGFSSFFLSMRPVDKVFFFKWPPPFAFHLIQREKLFVTLNVFFFSSFSFLGFVSGILAIGLKL